MARISRRSNMCEEKQWCVAWKPPEHQRNQELTFPFYRFLFRRTARPNKKLPHKDRLLVVVYDWYSWVPQHSQSPGLSSSPFSIWAIKKRSRSFLVSWHFHRSFSYHRVAPKNEARRPQVLPLSGIQSNYYLQALILAAASLYLKSQLFFESDCKLSIIHRVQDHHGRRGELSIKDSKKTRFLIDIFFANLTYS